LLRASIIAVLTMCEVEQGSRQGSRLPYDRFFFDEVFSQHASTKLVYEAVQPLVQKLWNGYNGCVFAYGQTNSGKVIGRPHLVGRGT
jgi:hypothetical protein